MRSNSKRHDGFGLLEVIISMAIIGIISMSIYSGYILAIKHTKEGQVKQKAALNGKKVVEEIKSTNIKLPASANSIMQIGDISLRKQGTSDVYNRFLDENFSEVTTESSAKYVESVTIWQTNGKTGGISLDNSVTIDSNDVNYKFDISKEKQLDNSIKDFIYYDLDKSNKSELNEQDTIILSVYLDTNNGGITIRDFKGNKLLNSPLDANIVGKLNISFNFDEYKKIDSSSTKPIKINLYNKTKYIPNVYVEKSNSSDLNVGVEIFKGQMNLYDNRAENSDEAKIGNLYDIKVELMNYKQYKYDQTHLHDDKNDLFTAYLKQNIK